MTVAELKTLDGMALVAAWSKLLRTTVQKGLSQT